jgi:hypothetical protein
MLAYRQFLEEAAAKGEAVNLVFEQRLFELAGILHRITRPLAAAGIPHEVIGGLAVLIHVEAADPTHSMLTRDVDLMIHRSDLEAVKQIAAEHGFRFRHTAGVDMLLYGDSPSARNAVHLVFAGEKVRPAQASPNPPIDPEIRSLLDVEVPVIGLAALLRMKLSSNRLKDQVHVQAMDAAGLITPKVEEGLPGELLARLRHIREAE